MGSLRSQGRRLRSIARISAKRAVTSDAGGEARRARQRFARGDDREAAAHFVVDRFFLGKIPLPQRRQAIGAQAFLRKRRYLPREPDRMRHRLAAADDAVGEPHTQRLVRADGTAGEDQVDRLRMADQPRQADGAEIDQGHAEAAAEDAEGCIVGDHAHVGP